MGNSPESIQFSLREQNRQRTQERIVTTAMALFQTSGYDATTMDAIAEKAGISRATLFNYFPTKDSLLSPFVEEVFKTRIQPDLTRYLDTNPSMFDALHFLFMSIYEHVMTLPGIDRAMKQEFFRPKPMNQANLSTNTDSMKSFADILRYGQERGEVRLDLSLETLIRFVGILYVSSLMMTILHIEETDYRTEIDKLLSFIASGIQTAASANQT